MSTNQGNPDPWQWEESEWRAHVARVRAGRRLVRPWPGGARVAVALSFDADHETIPLRTGVTEPVALSLGEYGSRVAAGRILQVLEHSQAPATFFMPAVSALLHPQEPRDYQAAGHEVAVHGWIHEDNARLTAPQERELTARAADTLERLTGRRPSGIRAPSWSFSHATASIITELIAHVAACGDAWFATHAQIAAHVQPELAVRATGQ